MIFSSESNIPTHNFSSSDSFHLGLVQVITGDGKGKTTSALGTAVRAAGHGLKVLIIFFMKGNYPYGEQKTLAQLPNITVKNFGHSDFVYPSDVKPEQIREAKKALAAAREAIMSGKYDLVVLDEINVAVAFNLITLDEVLALIREKPKNVELILTGRKAAPEIVKAADLVTECLNIKHPYDNNVPARKGIEY